MLKGSYDRIGNITAKSDVGNYSYTYGSKPHAVRTAGSISLQYDANGNMTQRSAGGVTLDLAWNENNKPSLMKRNGTNYVRFAYDGNGERVRKENLSTGAITRYFGDIYEERRATAVIHLFANNRRIVSIRSDGYLQYDHGNHLGSASVVTDAYGNRKETIEYFPFGAYRIRTDYDTTFPNVSYTFTDQEDDDETGFYNFKARLYDPTLGRFISADAIVPQPGNLQAFNRYSYCVNSPLVYVDPSGHWFGIDDLIAAVVGAVVGGVYAAITGEDVGKGAIKGAFSAWVMYNTGMELRSAGVIQQVTQAGAETITNLPAAVAAHVGAGTACGAFNTAFDGGNLGLNMLTSGLSAGMAKGIGSLIPIGLTGNKYTDFGIDLAGHAAIGGVTGGTVAKLTGGDFGKGFKNGAMAGAYGYLFNATAGKWIWTGINVFRRTFNLTPTAFILDEFAGVQLNKGADSMMLDRLLSSRPDRYTMYFDSVYYDKRTGASLQIQSDDTVLIRSSSGFDNTQRVEAAYYLREAFGKDK